LVIIGSLARLTREAPYSSYTSRHWLILTTSTTSSSTTANLMTVKLVGVSGSSIL
jgi:hypothetical protein